MTEHPVIVIDTREQTPLAFPSEVQVVSGTLAAGDYSVKGLEEVVTIERKSLPDLVGCVGADRERFERELARMRGYRYRAVVIEARLKELEAGKWRGKVTPASVLGSLASWRIRYGIDFIYCESPELAAAETLRLLRKFRDWCADWVKRLQ